MDERQGLTLVELLVVVGVVTSILPLVLCTRLLMLAQQRQSQMGQVQTLPCQANLQQWALVFAMYTEENDGYFFSGGGGADGRWWMDATLSLWQADLDIFQCPLEMVAEASAKGDGDPFGTRQADGEVGSYGLNGWVCNPRQGKMDLRGRGPITDYWRSPNIKGAGKIPVFLDAMWSEGWPRDTDNPPPVEDWPGGRVDQNTMKANQNEVRRFCVNRHKSRVNVLFMDWSVRSVGLKELWTLKWHRNYDMNGPWTSAGGVSPTDWPPWMRNFKDYRGRCLAAR